MGLDLLVKKYLTINFPMWSTIPFRSATFQERFIQQIGVGIFITAGQLFILVPSTAQTLAIKTCHIKSFIQKNKKINVKPP